MMLATILGYFTVAAFKGVLSDVWTGFCNFISTPVGAALIAGLVMYGIGDAHGHRVTNAAWETKWSNAEAAAERARVQRDADIGAKVKADADERLAAINDRKTQLEQQVQAYEDDAAKRSALVKIGDAVPPCTCTTDSSDARWLRDAERGAIKPKAQRGFALRLRTISH